MKILAFDTCNSIASAAIIDNDKIVSYKIVNEPSKQAEQLISLIEYCLKETSLTLNKLDAIAVTNGPGSFTGVRIGLSAAKGLGIATNLPLISVSCLEVLAYNFIDKNKEVYVVMDARRGQLFFQNFHELKHLSEPMILTYDETYEKITSNDFIIVGEGGKFIEENLKRTGKIFEIYNPLLDAKLVAKSARIKFKNSIIDKIEPLYIREADAKKPSSL